MDSDGNALVFGTAYREPDEVLEDALRSAFQNRDLRRVLPAGDTEGLSYQVRFPLPLTFSEARTQVEEIREGLAHLLAISGLHVGLLGFFSYLLLKGLLKSVHRIMLQGVITKIAALGSLPVIFFYILLVDTPVT